MTAVDRMKVMLSYVWEFNSNKSFIYIKFFLYSVTITHVLHSRNHFAVVKFFDILNVADCLMNDIATVSFFADHETMESIPGKVKPI